MSSNESKRNPSQGKQAQEKGKQGTPAQPQNPPGAGTPRAWPFDETGNSESASESTNPQNPPIDTPA